MAAFSTPLEREVFLAEGGETEDCALVSRTNAVGLVDRFGRYKRPVFAVLASGAVAAIVATVIVAPTSSGTGGEVGRPSIRGGVGDTVQASVVIDRPSKADVDPDDDDEPVEEEDENACAAPGSNCLKSKCCKQAGHQCFTKDAWWGQCMVSCSGGPNVVDQASPLPWTCKALGERTPGEPPKCSGPGEDCRSSKCCSTPGTQCFMKNKNWGSCLPSCEPGPNFQEPEWNNWWCRPLGPRSPGAAPWVQQKCAQPGENCAPKGCCATPGHQCYKQSPYYSKCKPSCEKGEKEHQWDTPWSCETVGMRTPSILEGAQPPKGKVALWAVANCSAEGENCLDTHCCHAVGHRCFAKNKLWATCKQSCSTDPDPYDNNSTWSCKALGGESWGLPIKGAPSLYCISLFMPKSYEGELMGHQLKSNGGIFACDGYDIFANEEVTLGYHDQDDILVKSVKIPTISVGVSQDGTAGNAKLFMAVWDKVIAGNRFRNYDFTIKADPDAVLIAWKIRDHMSSHVGQKAYVVNCNKVPGSPNFPMMFGAVEVFSRPAMDAYAAGSWKCGQQLPWGSWGEDYYMTHCMDFLGVGRIADFGVLGDNVCTGANCMDQGVASFHPFKTVDSWKACWWKATKR